MKDEKTYDKKATDDNRLMDYLKNNLSDQERHAFEMDSNDDPFLSDALEGLVNLNDPQKAAVIKEELQQFITQKTSKKKDKRYKPIQFPTWLILLITTIFLMALAGIILIKWLQN